MQLPWDAMADLLPRDASRGPSDGFAAGRRKLGGQMLLPAVDTLAPEMASSVAAKLSPAAAGSRSPSRGDWSSPSRGPQLASPTRSAVQRAWRSPSREPHPPPSRPADRPMSQPTKDVLPDGNWLNVAPVVKDCFRKMFSEIKELATAEARLTRQINLNHSNQRVNGERQAADLWKAIGELADFRDAEIIGARPSLNVAAAPQRIDGQRFEDHVAQTRLQSSLLKSISKNLSPSVRFRSAVRKATLKKEMVNVPGAEVEEQTAGDGVPEDSAVNSSTISVPANVLVPSLPRDSRKAPRSPRPKPAELFGLNESVPSARGTSADPASDCIRLTSKVSLSSEFSTALGESASQDHSKVVSALESQMQEMQEQLASLRSHNAAAAKKTSVIWARVNNELSDEMLSDLVQQVAADMVQRIVRDSGSFRSGSSSIVGMGPGVQATASRAETLESVLDADVSLSRRPRSSSPRALPEADVSSPRPASHCGTRSAASRDAVSSQR